MKIALITGDHLRHTYLANSIYNNNFEIYWIIQKREAAIPEVLSHLSDRDNNLFINHFKKRKTSEIKFFKNQKNYTKKKIFNITSDDFKNGNLLKIINNIKPNILISYGCNIIEKEILDLPIKYFWNVHGGLSPWYRGTATHFWPTYNLEPQFTGMTLHNTTSNIDAGDILHQTACDLNFKDGIHEHACRNVKYFCDRLNEILKNLCEQKIIIGIPQNNKGKLWTNKMWEPSMLKKIYMEFDNNINQYCIENKLDLRKPKLLSIIN